MRSPRLSLSSPRSRPPARLGFEAPCVGWTAIVICGFAAALVTHAILDQFGQDGDDIAGQAYLTHPHIALLPTFAATIIGAGSLLMRSLAGRLAIARTSPTLVVARTVYGLRPLSFGFAFTALSIATLTAMEFTEQLLTFGHITDLAAVFGGNLPVGLTIALAAAVVVCLTCRLITSDIVRSAMNRCVTLSRALAVFASARHRHARLLLPSLLRRPVDRSMLTRTLASTNIIVIRARRASAMYRPAARWRSTRRLGCCSPACPRSAFSRCTLAPKRCARHVFQFK